MWSRATICWSWQRSPNTASYIDTINIELENDQWIYDAARRDKNVNIRTHHTNAMHQMECATRDDPQNIEMMIILLDMNDFFCVFLLFERNATLLFSTSNSYRLYQDLEFIRKAVQFEIVMCRVHPDSSAMPSRFKGITCTSANIWKEKQ